MKPQVTPQILALVDDPDGEGLVSFQDCPPDYYAVPVFAYPVGMSFPATFRAIRGRDPVECQIRRTNAGLMVKLPGGLEVAFRERKEDCLRYTGSDPALAGQTIQPITANAQLLEDLCSKKGIYFVGSRELKAKPAQPAPVRRIKP